MANTPTIIMLTLKTPLTHSQRLENLNKLEAFFCSMSLGKKVRRRAFKIIDNLIDVAVLYPDLQYQQITFTLDYSRLGYVEILTQINITPIYFSQITNLLRKNKQKSAKELKRLRHTLFDSLFRNYLDGISISDAIEYIRWLNLANIPDQQLYVNHKPLNNMQVELDIRSLLKR